MSKAIEINDPSRLRDILGIFSALDDARWSDAGNYNLINYCEENLTPDEKLLTHWLCYVTDRQTLFGRIWDVGGYVISHLVRDFTRDRESISQTLHKQTNNWAQKGLTLKCALDEQAQRNERLKFYRKQTAKPEQRDVEFASRYMPTDMLSIHRTLFILDRLAQRSLTRFIYQVVQGESEQEKAVRKLAAALHFLTYKDIGTPKAEAITDDALEGLEAGFEKEVGVSRWDTGGLPDDPERPFDPHGKKRLWCSIRDYLKSPEFNEYLVEALEKIDREEATREATRWARKNLQRAALAAMELPGDVWNNNRIFREGVFGEGMISGATGLDMPRTIRAIYDTQTPDFRAIFYPEQLDVTFDFVRRMCGELKCRLCVFGGGIGKLCHKQKDAYCPVVLAACGYSHPCNPENCVFKSDKVRGYCKNSLVSPGASARTL